MLHLVSNLDFNVVDTNWASSGLVFLSRRLIDLKIDMIVISDDWNVYNESTDYRSFYAYDLITKRKKDFCCVFSSLQQASHQVRDDLFSLFLLYMVERCDIWKSFVWKRVFSTKSDELFNYF